MKYTTEMISSGMIHVSGFMTIGLGIRVNIKVINSRDCNVGLLMGYIYDACRSNYLI
jgi:hypothetical protein